MASGSGQPPRETGNIKFSPLERVDPKAYPHEYFVTREDDWHNEEMFGEWLKQSPGKGLRFRKINVHSDLQIPGYLNEKVLREIFRQGVRLNHKYFSGVKQTLDVALGKFHEVGTFKSGIFRITRGSKGLELDVYLKGLQKSENVFRVEAENSSVVMTGEFTRRNLFKRLDTSRMRVGLGLFELSLADFRADTFFPYYVGMYGFRPFVHFRHKPVSLGRESLGINHWGVGAQIEKALSADSSGALGVEWLQRSFCRQTLPWVGREGSVEQFFRQSLGQSNLDDYRGSRVYFSYHSSTHKMRFLLGDIRETFKTQLGFLAGNDIGLELNLSHLTQKTTKGYSWTNILHLSHLLQLDLFQSFTANPLGVNRIYDESPRLRYRLREGRVADPVLPQTVRFNNTFRVDFKGFSDLSQQGAVRPFLYASNSVGLVVPQGGEEARVKTTLQLGGGLAWTVARDFLFNARLGVLSHRGFAPELSLDFRTL